MKLLFVLSIFTIYIFSDTIIGIGKAEPSYDNLSDAKRDAKRDAIKIYQLKKYSKYQSCLKEDFVVDKNNYKASFINEKSVQMTAKHIIVEATFDVIETKKDLNIYFQEKCQKKRSHEELVSSVKDTLSHFHLGVGVMGWSSTYGGEVFFGYEADNWWGIHATYSYQRLVATKKSDDTEINAGDTSNIGVEFSLHHKPKREEDVKIYLKKVSSAKVFELLEKKPLIGGTFSLKADIPLYSEFEKNGDITLNTQRSGVYLVNIRKAYGVQLPDDFMFSSLTPPSILIGVVG